MAKQAKKIQTDYTRGGHDISQTAIPLYQQNLTRMDNYLSDPNAYRQDLIDRYYGAANARNQDFLRAYQRGMGNATANNWAATQGGYTSSGNKSYTDQQRYWNDLASRLQDYGVQSAADIASNDYRNMLYGNQSYQNAYSLGKDYSDIEQYNNMVDQANNNWWAQGLGIVGKGLSAVAPFTGPAAPFLMAGGALTSGVGDAFTVDASGYLGQQANPNTNGIFTNLTSVLGNADWGNLWNRSKNNTASGNTGLFDPNSKNYWKNQIGG